MIQLRLDNMIEKPLPEYYEMLVDISFMGVLANSSADSGLSKSKIAAAL